MSQHATFRPVFPTAATWSGLASYRTQQNRILELPLGKELCWKAADFGKKTDKPVSAQPLVFPDLSVTVASLNMTCLI